MSWIQRLLVAVAAAIPVGMLGALAFNPDSGAILHSEVLWRVFGIAAEIGVPLLFLLLVLVAAFDVCRGRRARDRPQTGARHLGC